MTSPAIPSVCPGCGAPVGKGSACDYCGSALPNVGTVGAQANEPNPQITSQEWLRDTVERPMPPPRSEPFAPPPPSGLEPVSLALGEGWRYARQILGRAVKPVLIGCAVLFFLAVACAATAVILFSARQ
jgi:hypothetical protein